MKTVEDLIIALDEVDMVEETNQAIANTDDKLLLLVKEQLQQGIDASGNNIVPAYAQAYYARKKNRMNPVPGYGVPDLKLTGGLYEQMTIANDGEVLTIDSKKDYTKYNEERYTSKVLEPTDENLTVYAEKVFYPEMINSIQTKTGLEFNG